MTQFSDLGLSQPVLQALDLKGYSTPTPIQEGAIPPVLEGRDLMGIAQTGTGKTAAFMLPSIDRLREADKQTPFKSCRMLVLAPTRELAGQIAQSAKDYGALAGHWPARSPRAPRITARWRASRSIRSSVAPRSTRTATSFTAAPTSSLPRPAGCSI